MKPNSLQMFCAPIPCQRLLLCLCAAVITGCTPKMEAKKEPPPEVLVQGASFIVQPVAWPLIVRCQGSLVADETTIISAKVAGRIDKVQVEVGDTVAAGVPLILIDAQEYRLQADQADAQLTQARAAVGLKPGDPLESLNPDNAPPVREAKAVLDEATKALARLRTLKGGDAVSETDLEIAESAERVAAARLASAQNSVREKIALISVQKALRDLAQQKLVETQILSPFEGRIQSRTAAEGTYVQPGQSLMTLVKTQKLRFRSSVPERYAHQLKIGQKVSIRFDLSQQTREGQVTRISPNLDPQSRSLSFEVDLDNADQSLRSGLFAEASIEIDPSAQGIALPLGCLQRFAGIDKVWKITDGKVKEQVVTVGMVRDDLIEIRSGLTAGDVLLSDGPAGRPGKWAP
jgi:RND family efflux transporter MFP subunit